MRTRMVSASEIAKSPGLRLDAKHYLPKPDPHIEKVEKMARAMSRYERCVWNDLDYLQQDRYRDLATVALKASRAR